MHPKIRPMVASSISHIARTLLLVSVITMIGALAVPPMVAEAAAPCNEPYNPPFNPEDFKDKDGKPYPINNPYFPLKPGTTLNYEKKVDGELERVRFQVTHETKTIRYGGSDVRAVVVRDRVTLDGKLIELTDDWFAQDKHGNVWYLGEASRDFDPPSTKGSWESGKDGAKPGIIMKAQPKVGDTYRQEFYKGEAEDAAKVLSLSKRVKVPYGSFSNVLQTKDFSCIPGVPDQEHKYYAKGVGMVLSVNLESKERLELVSVKTGNDSEDDEDDEDDD
ncbi:MAG: hypothetical protein H0V51_01890 [Chloroflexi bacterium]|nr:hypothetical protein [Chloroflexota bacterium]